MSYARYLKELLRPLGVYRLEGGLGAGELDGERHRGAHSVSTAARAFTRVEISSTAPSMPVVLELRVRS